MSDAPSAETLLAEASGLEAAGDDAAAFEAFKTCARLYPRTAPAWLGAARILIRRGDRGLATQVLSAGLGVVGETNRHRIAPAFAALLGTFSGRTWHPKLERDLLACFAEPAVEHQVLARVAAELLLAREAAAPASVASSSDIDAVARDPLWLAFLSLCLNVEAAMEARIVALRAALIARVGQGEVPEPPAALSCALALQAFAGEYLASEIAAADLSKAPFLATLAAPLAALEDRLDPVFRDRLATVEGGLGALLLKRTLDDLIVERGLAKTLPSLASGLSPERLENAVSAEVRRQYESNPYPRWAAPPRPERRPMASVIAALPGFRMEGRDAGEVSRLLIAGCGTGYEAIDLARIDPSLRITALDFSRPSLAYGVRMAIELGVSNIDFLQGDILDLDRLDGGFDVAVSTGVLHHMDDPAAGLAAVVRAVRPGGTVRLGLYSERARAAVRAARAEIRARGLTATPEDIRAFRRIVFAVSETSPLAPLRTSDDFYSLSGCRDLAFHVHERAYDPAGLGALLAGAGLTLVGFEAPAEATARFRDMHGARADTLDLALWDSVEARHPDLFAGMYHLWARTPAQDA